MSQHATRQAEMWESASPAVSENPNFKLAADGRYDRPQVWNTTNFGNAGSQRRHEPVYHNLGMGLKRRIG